MMELTINGVTKLIAPSCVSASLLLENLGVNESGTLLEINGDLFKANFSEVPIAHGDSVEIIQFMGGG